MTSRQNKMNYYWEYMKSGDIYKYSPKYYYTYIVQLDSLH